MSAAGVLDWLNIVHLVIAGGLQAMGQLQGMQAGPCLSIHAMFTLLLPYHLVRALCSAQHRCETPLACRWLGLQSFGGNSGEWLGDRHLVTLKVTDQTVVESQQPGSL